MQTVGAVEMSLRAVYILDLSLDHKKIWLMDQRSPGSPRTTPWETAVGSILGSPRTTAPWEQPVGSIALS